MLRSWLLKVNKGTTSSILQPDFNVIANEQIE